MLRCLIAATYLMLLCSASADDTNRLSHLNDCNPWYPDKDFPKLITPQWVGEDGVECVVVLAIDDMRDTAKYEHYLRPILNRLKQIDGRAPVSIMTNEVKPDDPQLQSWLEEGLSIECHTIDHPCPILQGGDLAKAKSTYDRCIDLLAKIPGSKPVSFRTPCCDSLNTVSPRFYSEIFPHTTPEGNFLQIDSSVMNFFTSEDDSIPRELVLDENGNERFWKYKVKGLKRGETVHNNFVNYITNYPYPYVINNSCWQFPCVAPSDWSAQHLHGVNNQQTVDDWKAALDITVHKQGVFNLVFHPHGWIKAEQVVEMIDHAVAKHGGKVKFLNFREAADRLNLYLLNGEAVRANNGTDNGIRMLDVDRDGFQDVVVGNSKQRGTRVWQPDAESWTQVSFPALITNETCFAYVRQNGQVSFLSAAAADNVEKAWYFAGDAWNKDTFLQDLVSFSTASRNAPMEVFDKGIASDAPQATRHWRFRDIDHDGVDEAIVTWYPDVNDGEAAPLFKQLRKQDIHLFQTHSTADPSTNGARKPAVNAPITWRRLPFPWPTGSAVPSSGLDPLDFCFVDLNHDDHDDLFGSNGDGTYVALFDDFEYGWTKAIFNVPSSSKLALPSLRTEDGGNNGFFVHDGSLNWIHEFTSEQPDLLRRFSFDELLATQDANEARNNLPPLPIGAAIVDITPDYPVRLSGYGNRTQETDVVASKIHARALAIGGANVAAGDSAANILDNPLSILLTVDNCGVPENVTEAVFKLLTEKFNITRERFAVSSSHSHSAPWLRGFAPNILTDVPEAHAKHLADYEARLIEQLVQVATDGINNRRLGQLSIGHGTLDFAINRRLMNAGQWTGFGETPEGPVDHQMPLLAARDTDGALIAVLASYACHATTETGQLNSISGDWPGMASNMIEADNPGVVALVAIGCGADSNPSPRGTHELAQQHARSVATEVQRLLKHLSPIDHRIDCQIARIDLPLGPLPTREEWEAKAKLPGHAGEHGKMFLKMLDEGKPIPTTIPNYPVQTWCFGKDLAMVFLGGEVVIDYAVRMNDMFDSERLWINAYSNDVPCYIASKRILREGGYEADSSMIYYARPTRLAPEAEDLICDAVQKLLPHHFYSQELKADFPAPKSPEESLAAITVRPGLRAELVAAEPLIKDPVAFDWDIYGRMWVVEMGGYPDTPHQTAEAPRRTVAANDGLLPGTSESPSAVNEQANSGDGGVGRVRVLEDTDGDGRYDKAVTFLDGLSFPTGLHPWRNGWLITCAPDIIYAEDTNGDFVADKQTVLYTGFTEGNQQHRVNGMRWGLDGWLYLANGDSGGEVRALGSILDQRSEIADTPINTRGRDLRIHPDTGAIETLSGQTQSGRNRDDFGNWFGNNNSNPIWHYVLEDRYLKRNPFATGLATKAEVAEIPGAAPVYPTSKTLARFNDFHAANRFTSACSTVIYRDNLLGEEFYGNAFTCEPVHNLVSRLVLERDGATFKGRRAADEQTSEFFASSDNWTRPVMVRTGPDGALYVADMYRQVIEHPEWIPAEHQRKMDLYAGNNMGRIYRVVPDGNTEKTGHRGWEQSVGTGLKAEDLAERMASPNGWWRDTAQRLLLHGSPENAAVEQLTSLMAESGHPSARVQAMWTLLQVGNLPEQSSSKIAAVLRDDHPEVRRAAIHGLEGLLPTADEAVAGELAALVNDASPAVRHQLALSIGESPLTELSGAVLGKLMASSLTDNALRDAAFTSMSPEKLATVTRHLQSIPTNQTDRQLDALLLNYSLAVGDATASRSVWRRLIEKTMESLTAETLGNLSDLIFQLNARRQDAQMREMISEEIGHIDLTIVNLVNDKTESPDRRAAGLRLLTAYQPYFWSDLVHPSYFMEARTPKSLQIANVSFMALPHFDSHGIASDFIANWASWGPAVRDAAVTSFLKRDVTTNLLFDALQDGLLNIRDFSAAERESLLRHRNTEIAAKANSLFSASETPSARATLVQILRSEITDLKSNATSGKSVFEKRCATCHKIGDVGKQIGADLAALKDRSTDALLTAIVDPNRAVESKFLSYTAVTTNGRTFSGMLFDETGNSLTLLGTDGKQQVVARTDLEDLVCSNRSLMPEGLEKDLSVEDLANVIAFVQTSGSTFKRFDGNSPRLITPNSDGTITLPAAAAKIYGPSLIFEGKYRNLGWWSSTDDYAVWTIDVPKSGHWKVEFNYACDNSTAGNAIKLSTGTRLLSARVPGTGTWDEYRTWSVGEIDLGKGRRQLTVTAPETLTSALIDLQSIRLIPPQ